MTGRELYVLTRIPSLILRSCEGGGYDQTQIRRACAEENRQPPFVET